MMLKSIAEIGLLPLTFIALSACASSADPIPDDVKSLVMTINERLEIADLVALTKWDSGQPVQDNDREVQVIATAQRQASSHGVSQDDAALLMAAQIEANKLVQYGLLANWHAAKKAPDVPRPDLKNQVRPRLDELQSQLLQQYARFSPYRSDPACSDWLNQLRRALARDKLHELALIRATGELCKGAAPGA